MTTLKSFYYIVFQERDLWWYPILEFFSNVALKHPTETHFQDSYGLLECDYMCLLKNSVFVSTECSVKEL